MLSSFLAALVGLSLLVYAIIGGFDLGIGLLSLIAPRDRDREAILRCLAPVWYGNAIWLVLAGFVLVSAFPVGTSLLQTSWLPLVVMLLALVIRGVSYALRLRVGALRGICDAAFGISCAGVILSQGLVLGAILSGIPATGGFLGLDLVLGMICAAGLAGGYGVLGAGWLIWRAEGAARVFGREVGHAALILLAGMIAVGLAWSAFAGAAVAARWFAWPDSLIPAFLIGVTLLLVVWAWTGLWSASGRTTFWLGVAMHLVVFAGLAASLWPDVVPNAKLDAMASKRLNLQYTLFDVLLVGPVLVAYLIHAYQILCSRSESESDADPTQVTHAGRRASTLRNELHLS